MSFKTELHCHTSDFSSCAHINGADTAEKYVNAGYRTLVITNHFVKGYHGIEDHAELCHKLFDAEYILNSTGIPKCDDCGGVVKPDVVLYEEGLDNDTVNGAVNAIMNADCLIVAGTSLTVYPAAGFIRYFGGEYFVLINRDTTPMDNSADLVIREKVGEVLSKINV